MTLGGSDVATDWRTGVTGNAGVPLFAATSQELDELHTKEMLMAGCLDDLLNEVDVIAGCTSKR